MRKAIAVLSCLSFVLGLTALPAAADSVTFESRVALHVVDDFDGGTARQRFVLTDVKVDGIPVPGTFEVRLPAGVEIEVGAGWSLSGVGTLSGDTVSVTEITALAPPAGPEATTTFRTLVMLVNLADAVQPCDRSAIEFEWSGDLVDSVERFFHDQSFGQFVLQSQVVGPYTISSRSSNCSPKKWASQADTIAKNDPEVADFGGFDSYFYIVPNLGGSCGGGMASGDRAWSFGACGDHVFAHELGHNLGLGHSTTAGNAYGDTSCTMGGSTGNDLLRHFNAAHKDEMGWILPERKLAVTQSGMYSISLLETDLPGTIQAITIDRKGRDRYYLSYRTDFGNFGSHLKPNYFPKLNVHTGRGSGFPTVFESLTQPGQTPYPLAFGDGDTFLDPDGKFCATQVGHDAGFSQVWISFECAPPPGS